METPLEWVLTHTYKADMITYLSAHPEGFEEAIQLALADKQPWSWRASWLLWSCMEANDRRIQPHVKSFINILASRNDNQQREILIILQKMEISPELEGLLFNRCVGVWEQVSKKPALRFNAFKGMVQIARNHPDLFHEVILMTQDPYQDELSSTAIKSITAMTAGFK
jgi:hypothetical protein